MKRLRHPLVRGINDFGLGDGEIEHLHRHVLVYIHLRPRVVRTNDQLQQLSSPIRRHDLQHVKDPPPVNLNFSADKSPAAF